MYTRVPLRKRSLVTVLLLIAEDRTVNCGGGDAVRRKPAPAQRRRQMGSPLALRRPKVVDFNEANARAVVPSRQQRGYGRLEVVCRCETRRDDLRGLHQAVLPVVIRDEKRSISIAQFQPLICRHRRSRKRPGNEAGADVPH